MNQLKTTLLISIIGLTLLLTGCNSDKTDLYSGNLFDIEEDIADEVEDNPELDANDNYNDNTPQNPNNENSNVNQMDPVALIDAIDRRYEELIAQKETTQAEELAAINAEYDSLITEAQAAYRELKQTYNELNNKLQSDKIKNVKDLKAQFASISKELSSAAAKIRTLRMEKAQKISELNEKCNESLAEITTAYNEARRAAEQQLLD